jgi:hypothetical protein
MKHRILTTALFALFANASAIMTATDGASDPTSDPATLSIDTPALRLSWRRGPSGWALTEAGARGADGNFLRAGEPSGRHTILYSASEPDNTPVPFSFLGGTEPFPEPAYRFMIPKWKRYVTTVSLNTAGEAFAFLPAKASRRADGTLVFEHETGVASVSAAWRADPSFPCDVLVTLTLTARRAGWFSMATPALATIEPRDLAWAVIPGYFKGDKINPDFVLASAYAHGLPDRPFMVAERCATSPASIATVRGGTTLAVIAAPGVALDPWPADKTARAGQALGLSHMNREGRLSPTLYHPVLGKDGSRLAAGQTVSFSFRYSLRADGWFGAVRHSAYDIHGLRDFLALKKPERSLSRRLRSLHSYVTDDATSLWHTEQAGGLTIGAQAYNGTVIGAQRDRKNPADYDALKNSDYGAMWMLARLTGDPRLTRDRLPFARNFKLVQQQTAPGFFQGAATGQYYLAKSKRFTEEWGDYVEPIAITYYTMLDLGNILLFEPGDGELRERLRLGAERLLEWQRADGSWAVAYDHATHKELFTETPDLRPTFYGLLVAHRILENPKFQNSKDAAAAGASAASTSTSNLNSAAGGAGGGGGRYLDAARRGADWFIENGVKPARFLGVCGDARFVPDFATVQSAQAFLDLFDATGEPRYREAAIECARQYVTDVFAHPVATTKEKNAGGARRLDWEINQTGLAFEHGGLLGSGAGGPILLASYAGLFVRMSQLTGEPLFRDLARAGVLARDAFLDPETQVASYYWRAMNAGAGPFPHHAWWQLGWITDYLVSEIQLRSAGAIVFPRGFITPKVGPHACYGFAPGSVYGIPANLAWADIDTGLPEVDYLAARSVDGRRAFVMLLNNSPRLVRTTVQAAPAAFAGLDARAWKSASLRVASGQSLSLAATPGEWPVDLPAYGLAVITLDLR